MRHVAVAAGLLLSATTLGARGAAAQQDVRTDTFPHAKHADVFPVCTGCHQGIPTGDSTAYYPTPQLCAQCHDGEVEDRVSWNGPAERSFNLKFTHPDHEQEMADENEEPLQCSSCHSPDTDEHWMDVTGPRPDKCFSCHAHQSATHYESSESYPECTTCHVPLARSGFRLARIESLPEPDSHDESDFVGRIHGTEAVADVSRCATCHVQNRCASCHVDAGRTEVAAVPAAPPDMELPEYEAEYPLPESHQSSRWLQQHQHEASTDECATCHTRNDCATCHRSPLPEVAASLPRRRDVEAPGADLRRHPPTSHTIPGWVTSHGTLGTMSGSQCATCHTESFCASCHAASSASRKIQPSDRAPPARAFLASYVHREPPSATFAASVGPRSTVRGAFASRFVGGPGARSGIRTSYVHREPPAGDTTPALADSVPPPSAPLPVAAGAEGAEAPAGGAARSGFHPDNYAVQHAADAWGRTLECANCHSTEVFCRTCHVQMGVGSTGQAGPGYHDAVPFWLFRHGTAARQGLESCASCHTETQCLRCHSSVGSFRVNPHGPDFDAERAAQRNSQTCLLCHLSDPLKDGGGP